MSPLRDVPFEKAVPRFVSVKDSCCVCSSFLCLFFRLGIFGLEVSFVECLSTGWIDETIRCEIIFEIVYYSDNILKYNM